MTTRAWTALWAVYLIWGSTYLGIKLAGDTIPAFTAVSWRFLIAGTLMAVIVALRSGRAALRITRKELACAALIGLLLPGGIAQFPVFVIVALLPWNYTAEAVIGGTRSVLDSSALVKKVYFPREVLPLASVLSSLLNFILSLPVMFLVMAVVQLTSLGRLNFAWTIAQ